MSHPHLLFLQRAAYPASDDARKTWQSGIARDLCRWRPPTWYAGAFERWRDSLRTPTSSCVELEVEASILTGSGAKGIHDFGLALHQTYGVPVIWGSSIKGVAAAWARDRGLMEFDPEIARAIFGDTSSMGFVSFHDALWSPDSRNGPFALDVLTPHHKDYGTGTKNAPPADWDSPTPVHFVVARGTFAVVIECEDRDLRQLARDLVVQALGTRGVGSKTAAGYGRLVERQ